MPWHDEMDILREVGSISAGQGSVALSEILGQKINLKLPTLEFIPSTKIEKQIVLDDKMAISVSCSVLSGIKGHITFILDEKSAYALVNMCYKIRKEDKESGHLTEMGISLIKEVGNVVISSYIGALGMMLKKVIIPSIPTLVHGPIREVISIAASPFADSESILVIEAVFEEDVQKITGSFYLTLNNESVYYIQDACKKILESLK
ncbi:MAG: chemotaxis protein CheC [Candidatus Omnitrophota bacterium]|nr:chemotaxis protein CheC [Candidatus Omnitrophota bacterium]